MKNNNINRRTLRAWVSVLAEMVGIYRHISSSDPGYDQYHEDLARDLTRRILEKTEATRAAMRNTIQEQPFFIEKFEQSLSDMFVSLSLTEMFDDEGICIAKHDTPETCFLNLFLSDTGNDWLYLKDSSLQFQYANPAMLDSLNLRWSELENTSDEDLYDRESCQRLRGLYQQVLGGKSIFQVHTRRVRGKSKTYLDVLVPLRNVAGFESFIAGVSRDVTEEYHEAICPITPDNRDDEPEPEPDHDDELELDYELIGLSPAMRKNDATL